MVECRSSVGKDIDVTIGLVSLDEEKTVGHSIAALMTQMRGMRSEMLVVAGGQDRTVEIAREVLSRGLNTRLVVDDAPRGKPAALNIIRSMSRGRILVLSDGDVIVGPESLTRIVACFSDDDVGAASGRVIGKEGSYNRIEKVCDLMAEMMHLSRSRSLRQSGTIDLASGYLLAIRKELMRELPLDVNSDDGYLSLSVRSAHKRIAYVETATVAVSYPKTLSDFVRQKARTRYGHLQLKRHFPDRSERRASSELSEYFSLRIARRNKNYGISISILTLILTSISWAIAYVRLFVPWFFRKRIWQPVPSTK